MTSIVCSGKNESMHWSGVHDCRTSYRHLGAVFHLMKNVGAQFLITYMHVVVNEPGNEAQSSVAGKFVNYPAVDFVTHRAFHSYYSNIWTMISSICEFPPNWWGKHMFSEKKTQKTMLGKMRFEISILESDGDLAEAAIK